jgi:2-oxoacid:acceptor oxidoreductase delta subunit (pyruvate/2-ketoisovalerate family)
MAELKDTAGLRDWDALEPGGTVLPGEAPRTHTGGWRTGVKPAADLSKCVNCLLCWLHCPDSAIVLDRSTAFAGFDFDYCKGCEICAAVCPAGAIEMVPEETELPELGARQ